MLRVHLSDGRTLCFDLASEEAAAKWLHALRSTKLREQITALTVNLAGVSYTLKRPQHFRDVFMMAERVEPAGKVKGGVRLVCQADNVRGSIMLHSAQRGCRIELAKTGRQQFNPLLERSG